MILKKRITRVYLLLVGMVLLLAFILPAIKVSAASNIVCQGNNLVITWSGLNTPVTVHVNGTLIVPSGAASGSTTVNGPGDWTVHIEQFGDPIGPDFTTSCPGAVAPTDDPRKFPNGSAATSNIAYRLPDGGFELYTYNPFLRIGFFTFRMTCADERGVATAAERLYLAGQNPNIRVFNSVDFGGHPISVYFVFPDQIQINGYFSDGKQHIYSFAACVNAHTIDLSTHTPTPTPSFTPTPTGTPPHYSVSASCTARGDATFVITNTGGNMLSNGNWQIKQNDHVIGTDVFRIGAGAHFTVSSSGLFGTLSITASGAGGDIASATTFCTPPTATFTPSPTNTPVPPRYTVSASCTARGDATFVITNTGGNMLSNGSWQIKQNDHVIGTDVFRIGVGAHFTVSSSGLFGTLSITASGAGGNTASASTVCIAPTATPTTTPHQ